MDRMTSTSDSVPFLLCQPARPETILLVGKSALDLRLLTRALSRHYRVMTAAGADAAMETAGRDQPDLILLDLELDDQGGMDVCLRLKAQESTRDIPFMVLTAASDFTAERQGLEVGAVDFISKPIHIALLQTRVQNHFDLKAYQRNRPDFRAYREPSRMVTSACTADTSALHLAALASMTTVAEFRASEPGKHLVRTMRYVEILINFLRQRFAFDIMAFDPNQIYHIVAFHDIGMVAVRAEILRKTGPLTAAEFDEVKRHATVGAELIQRMAGSLGDSLFLRTARDIAEFHHERCDGSGYPHGLVGDEIPLIARVMAVADVYDALVSPRPYKQQGSHEEAVNAILLGDGKSSPGQFCPEVLAAFRNVHSQFQMIAWQHSDDSGGMR